MATRIPSASPSPPLTRVFDIKVVATFALQSFIIVFELSGNCLISNGKWGALLNNQVRTYEFSALPYYFELVSDLETVQPYEYINDDDFLRNISNHLLRTRLLSLTCSSAKNTIIHYKDKLWYKLSFNCFNASFGKQWPLIPKVQW